MKSALPALVAACLMTLGGYAQADKPAWAGNGKSGKHKEHAEEQREDRRVQDGAFRFSDADRRVVSDYYGHQARAGKCPPGLAKKNNGCLPPGQAKKWSRGHPLPVDVRYHELPRELLKRLPPPPPQHRIVQIAGDIVLIAIGTKMVVDAIEDIMR